MFLKNLYVIYYNSKNHYNGEKASINHRENEKFFFSMTKKRIYMLRWRCYVFNNRGKGLKVNPSKSASEEKMKKRTREQLSSPRIFSCDEACSPLRVHSQKTTVTSKPLLTGNRYATRARNEDPAFHETKVCGFVAPLSNGPYFTRKIMNSHMREHLGDASVPLACDEKMPSICTR